MANTNMLFKISLFVYLMFLFIDVRSQIDNPSNSLVSVDVKDMPFLAVLNIIEQQTSFKFAYNSELVEKQKNVSFTIHNKPLIEVLPMILKGTNINFNIITNQIVLMDVDKSSKITISGFIRDSITGESLPGVVIYLPNEKKGTYTNNYGFFSVTKNQLDTTIILISCLGFKELYLKIGTRNNVLKNFYLTENNIQLDSIQINNYRLDDNIRKQQLGKVEISSDMVKTVPAINGNGDIMSTIQMLPGVMAGLDGRPGYFVRGGNTDQNLVQLDEASLYNPSHFLGLVSIFNSSAIKNATLLKGGFPASFGDHLSSVLDVTMKDGNNSKLGGDLQIGSISAGLTLSGPIVSNNASFFISARRSTVDLLLKPFNFSNYYSNYNFYDLNAKLNFKISGVDRLYISLYQGKDYSSYTKDSVSKKSINYHVNYGNQAVALRWNHIFSQKLFSNTSLIYNNYMHDVKAQQKLYEAELYSGIRDINFKIDFNYYPNINQKISTGISYLHQTLFPSSVSDKLLNYESVISIIPSQIPRKYADRYALYFSDEIWLNSKFSAYLGGRLPLCYTGNTHFIQFEPRLALMYLINPSTSLKISYTQMHQYLHLVQSYNSAFPAEIWVNSSKMVKPQNCDQGSIGIFKNFKENMFQASMELYYKKIGNQILFRGGLNPEIDNDIESKLIFGHGQSYGTELFIKKNTGIVTGWIGYTLSYSNQQFDSLNMGNKFPFANDRRHCLYLSTNYTLNKHWVISSNFIYTSGSAFTLFKNSPTGSTYLYENPLYYNYGVKSSNSTGSPSSSTFGIEQNNFRLAPYNRLDLSVSYIRKGNIHGRLVESAWVFSVYNVYARNNTFFAYCSIDPVTKQPVAVQVSFVPVIPSISYNLKF